MTSTAPSSKVSESLGTCHVGREYSAIISDATLGEYSLLIMPFIMTAMISGYHVSESHAGNLVSAQLIMMGIAGIAVSHMLRRLAARVIVAFSAFMVIVANALCALGTDDTLLLVGRCLTGLGEGSLMAAAGAIAAGAANPHRLYSLLGVVIAAVAAAALVATPYFIDHYGALGVFWLLAVVPIIALASLRWLPDRTRIPATSSAGRPLRTAAASSILLSFALLWTGASALWVFAELIGTHGGLSPAQVGTYLAIGQIAGLLGPIAANQFGDRIGLRASIVSGNLVMATAGLLMVFGPGWLSYCLGATFLSVAVMFLAPCYRTLMARLDGSGRIVATSVAFYTFGFGAAPAVVGMMHVDGSAYGDAALFAAAAFSVSAMLVFTVKVPANEAA